MTTREPDGWWFNGYGGSAGFQISEDKQTQTFIAERSPAASFEIRSSMMPGPVPLYFMNMQKHAMVDLGSMPDREAAILQDAAAEELSYRRNRKVQFIMGPAIQAGLGEESLRKLVKTWVTLYQPLEFLRPLADENSPFLETLLSMESKGKFETDVIDCLKAALQ